MTPDVGADLYWLPLGAGGVVVRHVGRLYERLAAAREHRAPQPLYHSALVVHLPPDDIVIEQTPAAQHGEGRGVVCVGPVGTRWMARWPLPRYEVHCWSAGVIPDIDEAVGGPVRITSDEAVCHRMLDGLTDLPVPVWGRDELRTGEMWNSNSVTAWVLARSGINASAISPPDGGRAPGWGAGCVEERRAPPAAPLSARN